MYAIRMLTVRHIWSRREVEHQLYLYLSMKFVSLGRRFFALSWDSGLILGTIALDLDLLELLDSLVTTLPYTTQVILRGHEDTWVISSYQEFIHFDYTMSWDTFSIFGSAEARDVQWLRDTIVGILGEWLNQVYRIGQCYQLAKESSVLISIVHTSVDLVLSSD